MSDFVGLPLDKKLNRRNLLTRLEMVERGNHSARPSLRADALAEVAPDLGSLLGSGWIFDADSITDAAFTTGMLSSDAHSGLRFFAGATDPDDPETGTFLVYSDGQLIAENATIFGTITAENGEFGGWTVSNPVIQSIDGMDIGIVMDSSVPIFRIGDTTGDHIQIDGANQRIRSSNFVAGASGFNIAADTGDAEFNNITARGELKTFLLSAGSRMITAGEWGLSPDAGKIAAAIDLSDTTIDFGKAVTPGDWARFKGPDAAGSNALEWVLIGSLVSGTTYNVTRNVDGSGANDWSVDTPFEVIGAEGDSRIEFASGSTASIQLITQGATWDAQTVQASMSTVDGAIVAGGGSVQLFSGGITIENDFVGLSFGVSDPTKSAYLKTDNNDFLFIVNRMAGKGLIQTVTLTDETTPSVSWMENPSIANATLFEVLPGASGGRVAIGYDHFIDFLPSSGTGSARVYFNERNHDIDFSVEGDAAGSLPLYIDAGLNKATSFAWDGWGLAHEAWTRTGNHTFTIPGDLTAIYRKGTKVRYNDGAVEYGVIGSSSHAAGTTTVNLIPNTNYAMAATTINDRYISYIDNPEGFPFWFTWAPTVSASGSMTWTTTTNIYTQWRPVGGRDIEVKLFLIGTTGGTASNTIRATPPITPAAPDATAKIGVTQINDGGSRTTVGSGFIDSTNGIQMYKANDANFALAASRVVIFNGTYMY